MDGQGQTVKVSKCCKAYLYAKGSHGSYYLACSKCGKGDWPLGCPWEFSYIPSDYEQLLEERIVKLEKALTLLQRKSSEASSSISALSKWLEEIEEL